MPGSSRRYCLPDISRPRSGNQNGNVKSQTSCRSPRRWALRTSEPCTSRTRKASPLAGWPEFFCTSSYVIADTNASSMHLPLPHNRGLAVKPGPLQSYIGQPFPTADYILLCCFSADLTRQRTYKELREELIRYGFNGPLVRHLISASPVLHRAAKGCYRVRSFED